MSSGIDLRLWKLGCWQVKKMNLVHWDEVINEAVGTIEDQAGEEIRHPELLTQTKGKREGEGGSTRRTKIW